MREYARAVWEQPVRPLFFLNASGQIPMSFVQALSALDYRPVLLSGPPDVKVVDVAITRTLEALVERGHGDVLLASHDGDFAPQVAALLQAPPRRVGVIGFRELICGALAEHRGRARALRPRGRRRSVHGRAPAHAGHPDRALRPWTLLR